MKKNFKKLGLKIFAGLLLCSCISGSKTMAMVAPNDNPEEKPPCRQQRRALEREREKKKKEKEKKEQEIIIPYPAEDIIDFEYYDTMTKGKRYMNRKMRRGKLPEHSEARLAPPTTPTGYAFRHINGYLTTEKISCINIEFITGTNVAAKSPTAIKRALDRHLNESILKAQQYIKEQGDSAPEFVPLCRVDYMVLYIKKDTEACFADNKYTCKRQAKNYKFRQLYKPFVDFLNKEDRNPLVEQMFPKKESDGITREELPHVVKAKQDEAIAIKKNRAKMLADEKAAAEERKELMKQFPPDYNASSLNVLPMMISDKKLQKDREIFEEADKAWLAEKVSKKRPKLYFPEAKEPAELSPLEMNPNYIPIPNIQALFPFCSSQHDAFTSLCKFLAKNRDLEQQICEVCEQIVNCFGKAQCSVTKLRGGLIIFENENGDREKTDAFEAYINDRYRVIFILHPEKGILFTDFGVHTI